jgi:NAD+ kinase
MHAQQNPRTFALIGKFGSPEIGEALAVLARYLSERGVTVCIEEETAQRALPPAAGNYLRASLAAIGARADLAIVLGGDGTMLNAARQLARYGVPLVGVNQGHLGFMTDIAREEMLAAMEDLLDGKFRPESRLMLDAEIVRDGRAIGENLALNDVVIDKGAIGRMIELELLIDGEFIYTLRADGLIVTTPTGSTAYSLSANGPVMHPALSCIGLVPLCPHALTNRPVIVGDRSELELRVAHGDDPRVHFDGQVTCDLRPGDALHLRRSAHSIRFLHPPGYSYFAMLREKLHWSARPTAARR